MRCDCGDSECRICGTEQGTREIQYNAPSWKELPAFFAMLDAWEKRLCSMPHDNQICKGLWLKLYGDGSGSIMGEFADVPEEGDSEIEQIRKVVFMEPTSVYDFDTLDELHGYLVCKTMSVKRGDDPATPTEKGE